MNTASLTGPAPQNTLIQPEGAVGKKELDRNDFMKLFISELQYQDPMKPMDNYEMASQMSQFSTMDATLKMNENMEKLLDYQTSQNNLQLLNLLGSQVQVKGNGMGVTDGRATPTQFTLEAPAETLKIEIYDAANHLIWQEVDGGRGAGDYELDWDGTNFAGDQVPDGAYHYEVTALDGQGEKVGVDYRSTGTVTGVDFADGAAQLTMDGYFKAGVDDVLSVRQ